jgi:SAM-dependent methyltransferase
MARFAREHFGLTVYVESETPIPAGEKFDLIVLFQVLEHLENPVEQLTRAASLLAEGGRIIVAVPNFSSWQSRFAQSGWFHLDVPRHLVHFSPESLEQAAQAAGLTTQTVEFTSFEHDPYGWVQSALNRFFKNENRLTKLLMRSVPWRGSDLFTLLLAGLLTPIAVVLSLVSWMAGKGAILEATLIERAT